jgi:hypothetical protein
MRPTPELLEAVWRYPLFEALYGRRSRQHEAFGGTLKPGKKEANERVERSLYQKANGYSYDAMKIIMPAGAKKPIYAPYVEHVPPSDVAAIFRLKNRDPAHWRDTWQVDHTLGKYIIYARDSGGVQPGTRGRAAQQLGQGPRVTGRRRCGLTSR